MHYSLSSGVVAQDSYALSAACALIFILGFRRFLNSVRTDHARTNRLATTPSQMRLQVRSLDHRVSDGRHDCSWCRESAYGFYSKGRIPRKRRG